MSPAPRRRAAPRSRAARRSVPRGVIPARGQGDATARLATFRAEAERAGATVAEVASADGGSRRGRALSARGQSAGDAAHGRRRAARGHALGRDALEIPTDASDGNDLNAVSAAFAGVAETGTLVLVSGADNPTTLNFLPDNTSSWSCSPKTSSAISRACSRRLRERYGAGAAAHDEFHHRPVAFRRHRADAAVWRARAAPAGLSVTIGETTLWSRSREFDGERNR